MIFFDFETCGFHGFPVLLQYAEDDGDIKLWDIWLEPVGETLELIAYICTQDVCGFNLTFDWFHMQKLYSTFLLFAEKYGYDTIPEGYIDEVAELEEQARFSEYCVKPKRALDLMLHARKGPYQSLMARKDIRIKKVPTQLAHALARHLEETIEIDGIYFSRKTDKYAPNWQVFDRKETLDFKDVVLKFNASGSLKVLAQHALKVSTDSILKFVDIEVDKKFRPYEVGWAPFAKALSSRKKAWKAKISKSGKKKIAYTWPAVIRAHIQHWAYNELARKYGSDDVEYTRKLYYHFNKPEAGDDDSELACMVGSVRWRGFAVDIDKIKAQRIAALKKISTCPTSPNQVKLYISECLDETEVSTFTSTKKVVLEAMAKSPCDCKISVDDNSLIGGLLADMKISEPSGDCKRCGGTGIHPAAARAQEVLDARKALKEVELYDKIIQANRLHASFKVIGTLSSRMAGADGLNAQGINHKVEVRACFTLADEGFDLCGGDFDSFEVVLIDAAYPDEKLRKELTEKRPCQKCDQKGVLKCGKCKDGPNPDCKKCKGTGEMTCDECEGTLEATYKIHGLFAMELYPGNSYADIIKSKGSSFDMYTAGKQGVFSQAYGGDWTTLVNKQGIDPEVAQRAEKSFARRFPDMAKERQKIFDDFCSMTQPGGLGTKVIWRDPADFVESIMGFRRYFILENKICKALFTLANKMPESWKKIKLRVMRRDREQSVAGAISSALYGASFTIQAANKRAAANHRIQSSGATITKRVQRRIWDIQPPGVHRWRVVPMNVHDEIAAPTRPEYVQDVKQTVHETVESFRPQVPLIKMDWGTKATSWATMK